MKKILFLLLLIGLGVGAYLVFWKKKASPASPFKQEQIIGSWKLDSIISKADSGDGQIRIQLDRSAFDSMDQRYLFKLDGRLRVYVGDSLITDSTTYTWISPKSIAWNKNTAHDIKEVYDVLVLNNDSLVMQTPDSLHLIFKRIE